MATTNKNVLAVVLWIIGLLGATGYINRFGFFALLIPLLFLILGSSFTRSHAMEYFNVLVGSVAIYFVGVAINWVFDLFEAGHMDFRFIALIYFGIMSIVGLFHALSTKRFKSSLSVRIFK